MFSLHPALGPGCQPRSHAQAGKADCDLGPGLRANWRTKQWTAAGSSASVSTRPQDSEPMENEAGMCSGRLCSALRLGRLARAHRGDDAVGCTPQGILRFSQIWLLRSMRIGGSARGQPQCVCFGCSGCLGHILALGYFNCASLPAQLTHTSHPYHTLERLNA